MAVIVVMGGCRKTPRGRGGSPAPRPSPLAVVVVDASVAPAFTLIKLTHLPCLVGRCGVFIFTVHGDGRLHFDADPRSSGVGASEGVATAREMQGLRDALAEAPSPPPSPDPVGRDVPDCGKASLIIEHAGQREELEYNLCNVPSRALGVEKLLSPMRHGRRWQAFFPNP